MCIIMGNNALLNQMIDNGTPEFSEHLRRLVEQLTAGGPNTTCYDIRSLAHGQEFGGYFTFEGFVKLVNATGFRPETNFKLVVYPTFSRAAILTLVEDAHIFSLAPVTMLKESVISIDEDPAHVKYVTYIIPLLTGRAIQWTQREDQDTGLKIQSIRAMETTLGRGDKQIYGVVCYVGGNHFVCYYKCEATNVWMYYNGIGSPVVTTLDKEMQSVLHHFEQVLALQYLGPMPTISHLMVK